ncbi:hypothetical protein GOV11_03870 [Candidatus Woesearchaeota archaeon]|nr:hypothetical protein [Candidatus Woesearchaeota archaeon]
MTFRARDIDRLIRDFNDFIQQSNAMSTELSKLKMEHESRDASLITKHLGVITLVLDDWEKGLGKRSPGIRASQEIQAIDTGLGNLAEYHPDQYAMIIGEFKHLSDISRGIIYTLGNVNDWLTSFKKGRHQDDSLVAIHKALGKLERILRTHKDRMPNLRLSRAA